MVPLLLCPRGSSSTAPTTHVDVLFRSCLAFPENTDFIIDLCSFVIFITWPALC